MVARLAAFAILALLAAVPAISALLDQPFYLDIFGRAMVYAIAAISLNLILGYGGLISFGHAAFIGIGGYAVGILSVNGIDDVLLQWPVAIGAAGIFALLTGLVVLRTGGAHFIMITLAFAQMLFFLFTSLELYGGDDGLSIPHRGTLAGLKVLDDPAALYYLILAVLAGALALSARLVESRFGMVLRGCKSNERRMRALGFSTFRYKLAAYVFSGALCGFAGALLALKSEFVGPSVLHWSRSGELIVMVVMGGMGTVFGPLFGALAYLMLSHFLGDLTKHWHIILGPVLILIVLYARGGLAGLFARLGKRP